MYAFGNHLRVANTKHHLATSHSRVTTTFEQVCASHSNDQNPMVASIKYVGWIEEILELDYGRFHIVVLLCNLVVANYGSIMTTMKCDKYGFTLVNFDRLIPLLAKSFAFPMHIQQVFFRMMKGHKGSGRLCCVEIQEG
jgi:hypothetical protein